jgi:hypothetical protein
MSRVPGERGSGTILMAGIMGVVVTLGAMAMLVAGYVVGYHRGRAAADLARAERAARVHRRWDRLCRGPARREDERRGGHPVPGESGTTSTSWSPCGRWSTVRSCIAGCRGTVEAEAYAGRIS